MAEVIGLSEFFVGIILVPIIAMRRSTAPRSLWALKDKMDIAVEIALGSSLQIILFVTPMLILSPAVFTDEHYIHEFELIAMIFSVC